MVLWALVILALLLSVVALTLVRRAIRRLETLNQSYWELRYDYTRLRAQVARLDPEQAAEVVASAPAAEAPAQVSFVPLSSIKRREQ